MNGLDDQLREALRRRQPPRGFAERVLGQVRAAPPRPLRSSRWLWAAAAALAVAIGSGSYWERGRRIEGERAKEQVMLALRLTSSKLRGVQERVGELQQRTIEISVQ